MSSRNSPHSERERLRQQLPQDLGNWRMPGNSHEAEEKVWQDLNEEFHRAKFTLWPNAFHSTLKTPGGTLPISSGFGYAIPSRPAPGQQSNKGTVAKLCRFDYRNPLSRAARTPDGHDVIIRLIVIRNEGHDHLKILRRIATGEKSLLSNNHTLPMFGEFPFEDLVFGIFPKVGDTMDEAYGSWTKNSVGDIIDMVMQMLEALAFIHDLNIAHRDAFRDNFVIQWHPESLLTMKISPSRPRVYLIDFEVAIEFAPESPPEERLSIGYPIGGSFSDVSRYSRPFPPEMASGVPYSPFKLDIWQLGNSLSNFKSTIAAIDEILADMVDTDPIRRPLPREVLDRLGKVVHAMPPQSLLIAPEIIESTD